VSRWGVLVLLISAGCGPRKDASRPPDSSAMASASRPAITLERTPCFGGCPVYTVAVLPSGEITYEGKASVRQLGPASGKIPASQVDALLGELEKAGYFSMANRYAASEPTCGRYTTDSPSVITTVTSRGRTKRIEHDYGCGAVPGSLVVLERRIDDVLGTGRWTGR
jgi:Domain of unknown function (DUF6438)